VVGSSDSFTLDLAGEFGPTATLNDFAIKIQSDPNSYELPGVPSLKTPPIPEPSTLILLGLGLVGLGFVAKRKSRSS
jgi:hypothetical protein